MSNFLDVDDQRLELLIDCINGNPLEVFKLQNKVLVEYSLRSDEELDFRGTFDPARLETLTLLLKGSKLTITGFFISWLHQYKYF